MTVRIPSPLPVPMAWPLPALLALSLAACSHKAADDAATARAAATPRP